MGYRLGKISFKLETRNFCKRFDQCYEKLYTHNYLWIDGMLAVTCFQTVWRDLTLVSCLSVCEENKENPVMFMTGNS